MQRALLLVVVFVSASSAILAEDPASQSGVEVIRITPKNFDTIRPKGKEVDAIAGDIVLRNKHITAVIAAPKATRNANMTVKQVGGALIDLTVNGTQSDQLSAFYPGRRSFAFNNGRLTIGKKSTAWSQVTRHKGESASLTVVAPGGLNRPQVSVTYTLAADSRKLNVRTEYFNKSKETITLRPGDEIRADGRGNEQMRKTPNGDGRLFWFADVFWGQAYGVQPTNKSVVMRWVSDARRCTLRYIHKSKNTVALAQGAKFELSRDIFPGATLFDVNGISQGLKQVQGVQLSINGKNGPVPRAWIALKDVNGDPVGEAYTDEKGLLTIPLKGVQYSLIAKENGVPLADKPSQIRIIRYSQPVVKIGVDFDYQPGKVVAAITGEDGKPIPCKIEFKPKENTPTPHFGPDSGIFGVRNVRYTPNGKFAQRLPVGSYDVIISRGPEFDAVFKTITVGPDATVPLKAVLKRVLKTKGWVSSDFHSHSSPSGDNTSSQRGRVLNLAAEHIEFAPCTEHNRVSTYDPHIKALGIARFMATTSGIELTGGPLPLNHQNAFPLIHTPHVQDGGGPPTDANVQKQIERLALWDRGSEKLIQQNHPDIGWLFFDRNGDGRPDEGFAGATQYIEVMEIHPIQDAWNLKPNDAKKARYDNRILRWLQLLNDGSRIWGVTHTDAHYNFHGSGGLRVWIKSGADDPTKINTMEMVRNSERGHLLMSNGPFVEATIKGGNRTFTCGDTVKLKYEEVTMGVKVQSANWVNVDRVVILGNGRPIAGHIYDRKTHPKLFGKGPVDFDQQIKLKIKKDTHIVVIAGSPTKTLGDVAGPSWGKQKPTAITNPIFIDAGGDGFKPNKDTLDYPLPVKFGTR